MSIAYPNVADRLFGRAHAIEPNALRAIVEGPLGQRVLAGERLEVSAKKKDRDRMSRGRTSAMVEAETVRSNDGLCEYAVTRDGVALISIAGVLSKRFDWLAAACGFATYEGLTASLAAALSDYRVKAVLFDIDSPGGQVDGMLEAGEYILAARAKLPIWAVANTRAVSAAYVLAGSAEKLYLPQLAQVGSIGAVMMHIDQSARDQAQGLKYSAIFSGARKIDGWEHASLSAEAKASAQAWIDHCRQAMCELIARQGRVSVKAALDTEAAVYPDSDAVDAKLADGVRTFDDALTALTAQVSGNSFIPNRGTSAMSQKDQALNSSSSAAIAAGQNAPPAAAAQTEQPAAAKTETPPAAAAQAAAPAAALAASAAKPKPGETCATCGQMVPDDDDDAMPKDPNAAQVGAYTIEAASKTLELCSIAKVPLETARGFVQGKMPLAKVQAELTRMAAQAADATAIDGTAKPAGQTDANVAAAWDEVVSKINEGLPKAAARR